MSTLDELVFYCRKEKPVGALIFFGESGCGKTFLIERELQEALKDSHFIVRISLFGITNINALHAAVRKQWLYTVTPILSKFSEQSKKAEMQNGILKFLSSVLKAISPRAGGVSEVLMQSTDYVVISPEAEDHRTKKRKRVVLVFDDIDRAMMNRVVLLGSINDYCENQDFNTIIVANREDFNLLNSETEVMAREAREKTIAYTVLHRPDFKRIVHQVIIERSWKTKEYAAFLEEHEQVILDLFGSELNNKKDGAPELEKRHNIRSLIVGLESFFRIHYHLTGAGIREIEPYFCSFLAFFLAERNGVFKNGETCFEVSDEEIRELYPNYSDEFLFESVRRWILFSYWDKELFREELSRVSGRDLSEAMSGEEEEPVW